MSLPISRDMSSESSSSCKEIIVLSWDIGEKNFAYCKSKFRLADIQSLKGQNIPFKQRYDTNGECLPKFTKLLETISMVGERVIVGKCDITRPDDKKIGKRRIITNRILSRLTNYLEDLNQAGIYDDVDYFLIEEQMGVASNNQQLQHHLRGYLISLVLNFRPIIMFPSKYKTQIMGAPKKLWNEKKNKLTKMSYSQRKKFSRDRVSQILQYRGDTTGLEDIFVKKRYGPPADVSDCFLQNEAFFYLVFIDEKRDILDC